VIEFLFNDLACIRRGSEVKQTRRLLGVGVSLGASVISLYSARSGKESRLDAVVAINCHFDTKVSTEFLAAKFYGFYDYALGYFIKDRMA
jgi:predicted alpha/beta-fold hydrolase